MPLLSDVVKFLSPIAVLSSNGQFFGFCHYCIHWAIFSPFPAPVPSLGLHTAHVRLLDPNLFSVDSELSVKNETRAFIGVGLLLSSREVSVAVCDKCLFVQVRFVRLCFLCCLWRVSFCLQLAALACLFRHCSQFAVCGICHFAYS